LAEVLAFFDNDFLATGLAFADFFAIDSTIPSALYQFRR
jgi:hypothetical protein